MGTMIAGKKTSLSSRIFQYVLIASSVTLILFSIFWIAEEVHQYKKDVAQLRKNFSETKRLELKNKIYQIKEFIYWTRDNTLPMLSKKLGTSAYSEEMLREHLLDTLSRMRYSKDEYIFVNTIDGKALLTHGKHNREPIDILASGDTAWISIFKVQQTSGSQPEGVFYTYKFKKISSSKTAWKTSFFSYLPEWKWIIGTGFYEDDVNQMIESRRVTLYGTLRNKILTVVFCIIVLAILSSFFALFFSKKLGRNIEIFRSFFEKAAVGATYVDQDQVSYKEFEKMAESANLMVRQVENSKRRIKESEAYYQAIFENTGTATVIIEEDSIISLANSKFVELSGYSKAEIENKMSWKQFTYAEDLEVMAGRHTLRRKDAELAVKSYEFRFINRAGEKIDILLTVDMIPGTAKSVASLLDITQRKQNEEKIMNMNLSLEERIIERTAQLVTINKELESFSYSISHDLRAPLRAINGFSQILSRRHSDSLNDEGRQYMSYIVEASRRMEQLINDLLHYSRLGRKSLNLQPIPLEKIVNDILLDFNQKLEEIGARFSLETELPKVRGDESLLRQVFSNLIENAIKYRRPDVPLEIRISDEHRQGGHVIRVSDNGIGIPKEHWEKIFNIFQRLHSDDKYPGTGIGLATVRKAVELMNGNVRVESVVGQGSTFLITFNESKT